jgi:hypothetical protein
MNAILLDRFAVDWITMTTFNQETAEAWRMSLLALDGLALVKTDDNQRWLQYVGFSADMGEGTVFWGAGKQGQFERSHWVVRVSGAMADDVFFGGLRVLIDGLTRHIRCTRIDFQVTHFNKEYLQMDGGSIRFLKRVFAEVSDGDGTASFMMDRDGSDAIATIGLNRRTAPAYHRIYAKKTVNGHCIRDEVEFKGDKAIGAFDLLYNNCERAIIGKVLSKYAAFVGSPSFKAFFSGVYPVTQLAIPNLSLERGESATEIWLCNTVLPAFERVVATSDRGDMVARLFWEAIRRGLGVTEEIDFELLS